MMHGGMLCPCCRQTLRRKARHRDRSGNHKKEQSTREMILASLNRDIENNGLSLPKEYLSCSTGCDEQLVKLSVENDEK